MAVSRKLHKIAQSPAQVATVHWDNVVVNGRVCGAVQVLVQLPYQVTIETHDITVAIGFCGDTNDINHAQIRYVWEIKHSPSGFISHTYLLGMVYVIHTYIHNGQAFI